MKRFSVIGAGNLGCRLIDCLMEKDYSLVYIYKKTKNPLLQQFIENNINLVIEKSDFIIIATQESHIREVAEFTAINSNPGGKFFFHTSNSLTSDELQALKNRGGTTASFSPLQTFPTLENENFPPAPPCNLFKDIYFLTEGDPEAVTLTKKIASDLDSHILEVEKHDKPYIHIAAVAASNFLISILKLAENQLKKTGKENIDIELLLPLVRQTLENVRHRGVQASLTGPFKRKETGIIKKHLELLSGKDAELYRTLTDFLRM